MPKKEKAPKKPKDAKDDGGDEAEAAAAPSTCAWPARALKPATGQNDT